MLAHTPPPPYYAVIFTSTRSDVEPQEYAEAARKMIELAEQQDGFLGIESARNNDNHSLGITVSYWRDEDAIRAWKHHADHTVIREMGREKWYNTYATRIARVERDYFWDKPDRSPT
jgi:heme-degrading monooxygenase HmoA